MNDLADIKPISDGIRDGRGRFLRGNPGGPGATSIHCVVKRKRAEFDRAALATITNADVCAVFGKLVELAKAGEEWAVKVFLDRVCGKIGDQQEPEGDAIEARLPLRIRRISARVIDVEITGEGVHGANGNGHASP